MSSTPTTVNAAATTVDTIISNTIFDVVVPAAETAVIAQVPWLGLPFVRPIFNALMRYIGGLIYTQMADAGIKLVITIQTDKEKSDYASAEGALRAAMLTKDSAQIAKATGEFKDAFQNLVHFDGSATPK